MEKAIQDYAAAAAKREAQREYHRKWRQNNPEKVRANQQRYWEKKGQERLAALINGEARA